MSARCEKCQKEIEIGDWPFCPHGSVYERAALQGPPTIVYKNAKGECWFPVGDNARPPKGYERHELTTQRERDKFEKEINQKETLKLRERIYKDREEWNNTIAHHKGDLQKAREDLLKAGYKPEILDRCLTNLEQREKDYDRQLKGEAGFYVEANHFYGTHFHDE